MSDAFDNCFRNITRFRQNNPNLQINDLELDDLEKAHYDDIRERDERIKELEQALSSWYNGFSQCEITPGMVRNTELILKGGKK